MPEDEGRVHRITVEGAPDDRLDRYLSRRLPLSRARIARLIADGKVRVNDGIPRKRDRLSPGDRIEVRVPPPAPSEVLAEPLPLEVVYEDGDLLVINKSAGMVVHPAPGHGSGTLVNALLHHVRDLSGIGGVRRPGIVHRLDKDTSGLMLVAKHDAAHQRLAADLKHRKIHRRYLAAAWGHLRSEHMTVDARVGRDPRRRQRMATVTRGGRSAVTHVRRLERWASADLLSLELETGRTHQIRVHLLHIGHPVVADPIYAPNRERGFSGGSEGWARELARRTPRLFLHATELRLRHPQTDAPLHFRAPLPSELEMVAAWARKK